MTRPKNVKELTPRLGHILRRFWPYTRNYRLLMTGSLLALMAEVFFRLLEPWMLALVLDHVIIQQSGAPPKLPLVGEMAPTTLLVVASVGLVLIVGLRSLTVYLSTVGFALVGNRVLSQVRADLYRHLHELSMSFHTTARRGDLTVRVIGDVGMLRDVLITAALPMLGNGMVLVGMVVVLFWLHWQLAALAMVTVPLFLLTTLRLTDKIHKVSREQRTREGTMASAAAESLGAIHIVKAMSLEAQFGNAFANENQRSLKQGVKGARLSARLGRTIDLLVATSTGIVLYFGATFVLSGQMTPGALVVFISYLKTAMRPMRDSAKYTGRLAKATAAGERILEVFDLEPEVRDLPGAVAAPRLQGRVCFDDVTFGYKPGYPVVNAVSITAEPGERVALVGPSGSGKSTLLNLLLRLYDPVSGRVIVDGRDVREYTLASLRTQIGVVLQETVLFAASIGDNIAYGNAEASRDEVEVAARMANAHDFIMAMPEGYDTVVGERGVTISGGERQRIAIARAALRRAAILVLDEPTTGLDDENAQQVTEALDRLAGRCTTFLVTHDLRQVSRADQIIHLEAGRIVGPDLSPRLLGGA
ncbi:MAG TPA: ABC transporter ATP-binding protein [Nocardioides sp.]|nr:ABC transporter ATP-binding protein [Nocardioides sp.]